MEEILELIDHTTSPDKMGKREAMEFMQLLCTNIECRIDGIKDDLQRREGSDVE